MQTKVKFLIVFAIILLAICLLNVNEVRATEVNEEYLNNLVNLLPDSINLDIPESQFDQVTDLSLDKIKQIKDEFDMAFDFSLIYDFFSNIFGLFMFSFGFNSSLNKKIPEVFEGDLKSN